MVKKVGQLCFSGRTCCFFDDIYLKSCKPFRAALMPSGVLQPKCLVVSAGNKDNGIWMLDATTGAASPCSKWEWGLQGASPGQTPDLGRNAQDLSYFSPWFVSSWKGKKNPKPHTKQLHEDAAISKQNLKTFLICKWHLSIFTRIKCCCDAVVKYFIPPPWTNLKSY